MSATRPPSPPCSPGRGPRRAGWLTLLSALTAQTTFVPSAAAGPNDGTLVGVIRNADDGAPIEGAVVLVTGEKLQGERRATTSTNGLYRIPELPAGDYELTVVHREFRAGNRRSGLSLRPGDTIRVDVQLVRDRREVVRVRVPAPVIDIGRSAIGLSIDSEMARRAPIAVPTSKGGAQRSFEALAEATPGAHGDTYGTSIAGTSSPENKYSIDGLAVGDPAIGINGTPLSAEFVDVIRVDAGGYMPEHGRSTGGIIHAATKRGSDRFHGGVWMFYMPGQLEGRRSTVRVEGDTLLTERSVGWVGDAGFDVGGPLLPNKLWFYAGFSLSRTLYRLPSSWNRIAVGPDGEARIDPETNFTLTERIAGTTSVDKARGTAVQALAKLTYSPTSNHTLELLGIHAPQLSGGHETYGIDARIGIPEVVNNANGDRSALARKRRDDATDVLLRWNARAGADAWSFDTSLGWHHQDNSALPIDGSAIGSATGLASTPMVIFRRTNEAAVDGDGDGLADAPLGREVHALTDFRPLPDGAPDGACDPTPYTYHNRSSVLLEQRSVVCPVTGQWHSGGLGFIYKRRLDRGQLRHVVTRFARGAGYHVIKFGVEFEYMSYANTRGYSGGRIYRENLAGTRFSDFRQYGFLVGPDAPNVIPYLRSDVASTTIGGFLQDNWAITNRVTLNAGVRYDAQHLLASDRSLALALPNQISPRVGVVLDPSSVGKAKIFVHFARYYQSIPLTLAACARSGEPSISSTHDATVCDPTDPSMSSVCDSDASRVLLGTAVDPDQRWLFPTGDTAATPMAVDPDVKPQSSDEIGGGGEYEVLPDTLIGLHYTHYRLNRVIEDMSNDEGETSFIGNPGSGIAKNFPAARRVYDAGTLFIEKRFTRHWMLTASYTLSWLRGNVSGLFRPENGQIEPHMNSDFDLRSLLDNRHGDLPGDTRHSVKIFAAGEIVLGHAQALQFGCAVRARSGGPTNYLGSHPIYGHSEVYILPRGSGERLPWSYSVDPQFGYTKFIGKDLALTISVAGFNIFNFQQVLAVDQRYTSETVRPIAGGTREDLRTLQNSAGQPVVVNPNFGNPTAYQSPRQFRFGVRLTF